MHTPDYLTPAQVAQRQAEMDALKRVWRNVCASARTMTAAEKAEARRRAEAKGLVGMSSYTEELKAAKTAECEGPVVTGPRLRAAGVQQQHMDGLAALDERPALVAARRWWSQPKVQAAGETGQRLVRQFPFLVLLGDSGLGKSQAAAWALREAARAYPWNSQAGGGRVEFRPLVLWHGADIAAAPMYGNHAAARMDEAEDEWAEARRSTLLVLDDLFPRRQAMSGPHTDRLTALLNARHGGHRSTVITANLDPGGLARLLDGEAHGAAGPLWRRVSEAGVVVVLKRGKAEPEVLRAGKPVPWQRREQ